MNPETATKKADYLLLLPAILPILFLFVYPLIKGVLLTVQTTDDGAFTLQNYITFFTEKDYFDTIFRTVMLVIPASIAELFVAFTICFFIRGKMRGKGIIGAMIIFPLTLGSLIIDMGIITFFRPSGWFNEMLMSIGLISEPIQLVYNYWGAFIAIFILGVAFLASNFIGMMDSIDPNLEIASRSLGASEWTTFKRVFYPLIRNNVLTVFGLNIIMQIGVYSSAVVVGNPASETRTFAVVAFEEAMRNFNYSMANTVAIVMAVTQISVLMIVFWLKKRGYTGSASTFK
ncbi:ABC transporter permease [Oceanobacillus massiliensis]|uniref:ABC transporter permease n=1 Tax=Oceanobacillus massiliensis TaxID=1465765 RepID=UPI000287BD77|nr:ABC transporter permease subunit [Oceanobacillus massiliensis]